MNYVVSAKSKPSLEIWIPPTLSLNLFQSHSPPTVLRTLQPGYPSLLSQAGQNAGWAVSSAEGCRIPEAQVTWYYQALSWASRYAVFFLVWRARSLGWLAIFYPGVFLASADKSILLMTQNQIASSLQAPSSAPLLLVSYNLGFCVALPVVSIAFGYSFPAME